MESMNTGQKYIKIFCLTCALIDLEEKETIDALMKDLGYRASPTEIWVNEALEKED